MFLPTQGRNDDDKEISCLSNEWTASFIVRQSYRNPLTDPIQNADSKQTR